MTTQQLSALINRLNKGEYKTIIIATTSTSIQNESNNENDLDPHSFSLMNHRTEPRTTFLSVSMFVLTIIIKTDGWIYISMNYDRIFHVVVASTDRNKITTNCNIEQTIDRSVDRFLIANQ